MTIAHSGDTQPQETTASSTTRVNEVGTLRRLHIASPVSMDKRESNLVQLRLFFTFIAQKSRTATKVMKMSLERSKTPPEISSKACAVAPKCLIIMSLSSFPIKCGSLFHLPKMIYCPLGRAISQMGFMLSCILISFS